MYEIKVTSEFIDIMKTLPSQYLVMLISQIVSVKEKEK